MITITDKKECCGCNSCGDICSQNAISFKTDAEGFWYPEVDSAKCINCGMCEKVCPIVNVKQLKKNDWEQPVCYAAEHKSLEVIFDSTSGGLFTALAEQMYQDGGYVGGAVFDENFFVKHFISNEEQDLLKVRNTKLLQSDLSGFYKKVEALVKDRQKVLVCGCPCQMAALRAFLRENFDNLIIVDFICKGNGSPKAWKKYLDSYKERYGFPVIYAKMKSKEYGWRNLTQKVMLENRKCLYETKAESNYTIAYNVKNLICRPSCYDCKFKGFPRISDITLGDFWGIDKAANAAKSMDKDLGISIVMINSKKGQAYFERITGHINFSEVTLESILNGNRHLQSPLVFPSTINRNDFFKDLEELSFIELAEKYHFKKITVKQKIENILKTGFWIIFSTKLHPVTVFQLLKYNHYLKCVSHFIDRKVFIPARYSVLEISRKAKFIVDGMFVLGQKRIKKSKLETRLLVEDGAILEIKGNVTIGYGSDVEVFKNARLSFGGNNITNINCTIICMERIEIGKGCSIGRNVTIRDNNGGHYMNTANYCNSKPVIIGEKVWLCEGSTVMPGVHIGDGAIVGAHSLVVSDVPEHAVVMGNPARVIAKDVLWKL